MAPDHGHDTNNDDDHYYNHDVSQNRDNNTGPYHNDEYDSDHDQTIYHLATAFVIVQALVSVVVCPSYGRFVSCC